MTSWGRLTLITTTATGVEQTFALASYSNVRHIWLKQNVFNVYLQNIRVRFISRLELVNAIPETVSIDIRSWALVRSRNVVKTARECIVFVLPRHARYAGASARWQELSSLYLTSAHHTMIAWEIDRWIRWCCYWSYHDCISMDAN